MWWENYLWFSSVFLNQQLLIKHCCLVVFFIDKKFYYYLIKSYKKCSNQSYIKFLNQNILFCFYSNVLKLIFISKCTPKYMVCGFTAKKYLKREGKKPQCLWHMNHSFDMIEMKKQFPMVLKYTKYMFQSETHNILQFQMVLFCFIWKLSRIKIPKKENFLFFLLVLGISFLILWC